MKGQENINRQIGRRLKGGLIKSLYVKGKLAILINVSFLRFDNDWVQVVCTDEQTSIDIETTDIEKFNLIDGEIEFRIQPIEKVFPDFDKFMGKKLLGFKELVLRKSEFMSFGLNLYFEDDLNFIIRNRDFPKDENEFLFEKINFDDLIEK